MERLLLQWPRRNGLPLDGGAYRRLLEAVPVGDVVRALGRMAGVKAHTPTASEIAMAVGGTVREDALERGKREAMERWAKGPPEGFLRRHPERAAQLAAERERTVQG